MLAIAIYLVLCLLVGFMAIDRKGGFLLFLILSVVLSPLVGVFMLLITRTSVPNARGLKALEREQALQK
jgi:hypothetical protein